MALIDVVLVQRGRAGRSISHFLLAVADRRADEGPPGPTAPVADKFSVFCKVLSVYFAHGLLLS